MTTMKLYGYWRSSCSWRVRIALHYKEIEFQYIPIHLVKDGGEQFLEEYLQKNPFAQVPVLEIQTAEHKKHYLSQSIAIMEYLEDICVTPQHQIRPSEPLERAYVRQLAEMINSGIQPIQNLAVLKHISQLNADKMMWAKHWIQDGLKKVETAIKRRNVSSFMFGENPTIADFCLIPQLYNARRFQCDLSEIPRLLEIESRCKTIPAFIQAHPDQQSDAT
jgi:maleylpyruvate isomerase